jgi:hypothetical protein
MTTPAADNPAPAAAAPAPAANPDSKTPTPAADPNASSLLPAADTTATTQPAKPADPEPAKPEAPVDPNSSDAWVLMEGVLGQGKPPEWFKRDKYATLADQAKAYVELEKRFGAFVGAPKDGKYENKLPDGVGVELVEDHPLLGEFGKWAKENQLSQKGYTELLGMLAKYEAQHVVDAATVKQELGQDADKRIGAIAQWAKANLDAEGYETLRSALVPSTSTAATIKLLEAVIAKTVQPSLPKPGADVPASSDAAQVEINKLMQEKDAKGNFRYFTDAKFREEVERKRMELFKAA